MGDRPILFSAPMVRALLGGRKTQTRRVVNQIPHDPALRPGMAGYKPAPLHLWQAAPGGPYFLPRYAVGDRLWVREAHFWVSGWGWRYVADNEDLTEQRDAGEVWRTKPSIHMPRRASRITLTVTDVRVQRLHDCSEADALAEGCKGYVSRGGWGGLSPQEEYRTLWDEINGPGAWEANPWVSAYTFTVARGNIDQLVTP